MCASLLTFPTQWWPGETVFPSRRGNKPERVQNASPETTRGFKLVSKILPRIFATLNLLSFLAWVLRVLLVLITNAGR